MITTDGLLIYYNCKQGVNGFSWQNLSPNKIGVYNGNITGAILESKGLFFNGASYVEVPYIVSSDSTKRYEIEIYLESSFSDTNSNTIFGINDLIFSGKVINKNLVFIIGNSGGAYSVSSANTYNYSFPKNNVFKINYFIDINNGIEKTYINNTLVNTAYPSSSILTDFNKNFGIGVVIRYLNGSKNGLANYFTGHIKSFKMYNRELTSQERDNNSVYGEEVGLESESESNPPIPTIISTSKSRISDETGMNQSVIKVKFDKNVTQYIAKLNGTSFDTGVTVDSGGAVSANTEINITIDWNESLSEGQNRINIYGQDESGNWTPYE